ncbi:MAG TPA: glycosyltransferase family 4 protein [Candidatus Paceibacterota bacterium]|nr:glycosyltransferase family 4 protein [Candidatus Paceibacterota bacterium]
MRLLITTQTLDKDDPYLGFFHDWVAAFAARFEAIEVICLREGTHALPANVRIHSLGKERGRRPRVVVAYRFLTTLRSLRGRYDAVYVHMNPEYFMLAGLAWRRARIPTALWYNHEQGGFMLAAAARLTTIVLHTSPYAASARFPNARRMPVGIDTKLFGWSDAPRGAGSLYFQGRVAPKKRVHVLLEALAQLRARGERTSLSIVGPEDPAYGAQLRARFSALLQQGVARFLGPMPLSETPEHFAAAEIAVNLTAAGNFDKTGLEALCCGTLLVASSPAYAPFIPEECRFVEGDAGSLARTLHAVLGWDAEARRTVARAARDLIEREHSLGALADALKKAYDTLVGL